MLFGGGGAGTAIARAAVASGRADVVAICEPDQTKRSQLIREFKSAEVSTDYESLLRETRPTIADVASPDHLHTEHTLAALESGCDVLVEKPLATSVEDARRMIVAAERHHAPLSVNFTLRYQYPTQEALQFVLDGKLGKPFLYQGFYVHDMWEMYSPEGKRHPPWRTDALNPQNVLLGGGCHAIDLILTAAKNNPVEVSAYANRLAGSDLPIDDSFVVNIVFEDGVLANVLVTTCANGVSFTPGYFNVYGTDGKIIQDTVCRRDEDAEQLGRLSPELGGDHNWQSAFERFINAIDGLSPVPVSADVAALNVAVCVAATESVKSADRLDLRFPRHTRPGATLNPPTDDDLFEKPRRPAGLAATAWI